MRIYRLLPFAAALLVAAPIQASPASIIGSAAVAPASDKSSLIDSYFRALQHGDYKEGLALSEKIDFGASSAAKAEGLTFRATALLGLKRKSEAQKLFAEADRLSPTNPFISRMQFLVSMATDNPDIARVALDRMIARFPDVVRELDMETMRWILREDREAKTKEADDRLIALARLGYAAETTQGDYLAYTALKALLKRGEIAEAQDLLQFVNDPDVLESLMIEKRYSPLWPKIEAIVGPHFVNVRDATVKRAEKRLDRNPADSEALSQLAFSLAAAERYDEVIALQAKLPKTSEAISKIDEHTGWVFDSVAASLFERGRTDEADQVYASLNENPALPDAWLVNMKINRLHLLVSEGKFEKALSLLDVTEKAPGSPYAEQLVRRMKYCILRNVGKADEAAKILPEVIEHAKDSYDSTIQALICAGQLDQAEKLALTALSDDEFQSSFVGEMQPVPLRAERHSIWSDGWDQLRKRPALIKEFERLGRPMPEQFLFGPDGTAS
ncbi:MAG TPA: hypothetical protein VFH89_03045 [Sphingomicrobium sp.]|nr:hypothetical protein [Sphingomicrobium sp.]